VAEERFDPVTPGSERQLAQDKTESAAEIKSEIERTRIEMSETLGEIQERLRPDHLIQKAKETVTDAATGKVRNIMHSAGETATYVADQTRYAGRSAADYARTHPLQMALLAGGITWWLLRRDRSDDWQGASEGWHDSDAYDYGDERSLRDRAGEYVSSARETVSEYADSAKETIGEYAGAARSSARRASARVRDAAGTAGVRARETWARTSTTANDWVIEYPVAAGCVAMAVGLAIGLSAPSTEWEDRALGERRDRAMAAARAKARELKDQVSQRAQNVADTVADLTAPAGATRATGAAAATSAPSATSSTTGSV
jgi:ElaB/YqjD/DUF883 family membrane-anchored ribosome-binding protein